MKRTHRLAVAATLTAALLTGGAATAMAATAAPAKPATQAKVHTKVQPKAKAAITAKPSVSAVRAWQEFRITGKATGIPAASKAALQQKQRGKWVTLPATTVINKGGGYSLRAKLGMKGKNELRVVSGATASAAFAVTVR